MTASIRYSIVINSNVLYLFATSQGDNILKETDVTMNFPIISA